ncbi:Naringenin-chalcone synthase [Sphingobium chlorophenolicum L-1]|uniref:Naringenin-chalcone synthase n=1 Tax=Sphingobium chlorophenolicum L-1 TaxID=690566 RepID=F6F281_SPHCR|nr:stilbene synthase [Sphingobium chlorophenolicum]AEG50581.1 Naringenin-chalcone synthase [Sphingobium chlorophenolicum L-1]
MTDMRARINAIGCAVPAQDMHAPFVDWAARQLDDPRERRLFLRMAERSGIDHRRCALPVTAEGGSPVDPGGFYAGEMPPTSIRMRLYADYAPALALEAIARLREQVAVDRISHLVVASCTGFVAPGIDQIIAERLGLEGVERTLVGFMGCYAAVAALRVARHIVRSEPEARVLVVTVELSSLHFQPERQVERLLMMLQFADGAAAALVTAAGRGVAIDRPFSFNLADSAELIRWDIGDSGFVMHLSGEVPGRIQSALADPDVRRRMWGGDDPAEVDDWAVHAGGRSILDAVEHGLGLDGAALAPSRSVLARFGNMSSSTLMFILGDMLERARRGVAMAFGPGVAAEGFRFEGIG